jgi:hypothetical protein
VRAPSGRASGTIGGISALAAALLVAGCGGGGDVMRATLTDSGCTWHGETSPRAGMFTIEVENQTSMFGAFAVARITDASRGEGLPAYLETAQRVFAETGRLPDPPSYYEQLVRTGVEAGSSSRLPADVPAGSYVVTCFVDDLPTWRGYLATELEVAE